ncbi:MAG: hypothetical protein MUO77_09850, partial [Anaerolineales bacterium]|nr:hypothetical protein [Anaerolineales bacterium]
MPKTFYTERDIDDLLRQGVKSLIVDDDVVLTDLAYEKARKLGLELLRADDQPPAAPVRPYIAKLPSPSASGAAKATVSASTGAPTLPPTPVADDLHQRVYKAALARLGDSVDPKLLDVIVRRVL